MEVFIKVGGSLIREPDILNGVIGRVTKLSDKHRIIIMAGGGALADEVRKLDLVFQLPAETSHRMALLTLDQNGLLLSSKIKGSHVTSDIERLKDGSNGVSVFLPSEFILGEESISPSWDFTSDSVAAYTAGCLGLKELVLLKDVDGLYVRNPKEHSDARFLEDVDASALSGFESLCVDNKLSEILSRFNLTCVILNGGHPERLTEFLSLNETRGTRIHIQNEAFD